ncbi:hypothetical protein BJ165DRAFT_1402848 [Panaeolus papilionaceus]|nr:hypothetical protein BJ165DRAFT_1402848 [Panaeolus papilionaceus]
MEVDANDSQWVDIEDAHHGDGVDVDMRMEEDLEEGVDDVEEDEIDVACMQAKLEQSWEPVRQGAPSTTPTNHGVDNLSSPPTSPPPWPKTRIAAGHGLKSIVVDRFSDQYPSSKPGEVVFNDESVDEVYSAKVGADKGNPWAPFNSKTDWDIACWAKKRGPGSTAFTELLGIDSVQEKLGLSYKTSDELNKIIDKKLPSRPPFQHHEVVQNGQSLEFYSHDIIQCIQSIWRDPDFVDDLILQPEKHFTDNAKKTRVYHDMHTGKWWWSTQKKVEQHTKRDRCTIIPVILSSDKTQLTEFRGQQAYPVYMTIGNLPKHIRHKPTRQAQILIAYLPTTKLKHITNCASRRRCLTNLFHHCMSHITKPLGLAGRTGAIFVSGDGKARRCYPILAAYVGDYPEQLLVTCVKFLECPVCPTPRNEIGNLSKTQQPRSSSDVIKALGYANRGRLRFHKACKRQGIKPVQSVFWKSLPHVDIYRSITPDILHQLYQGVFKHLISWIREAIGDEEIDARCRRLPPNHHIRLFLKGITHLSRVTSTEHSQISRFLLALVADVRLPNQMSNSQLVRCVRALLNFMEIACYPVHSQDTLGEMNDALQEFHDTREIFVELGICEEFNIPKIHFMSHYTEFIKYFGSPDNFNTKYTEQLHIDQAKDAYAATNCKDEYPQMTRWLDRKE